MTSLGILGGGAWGTALASMYASNGRSVCLWARDETVVDEINSNHSNGKFLRDVELSNKLVATTSLTEVLKADIVLFVTPAQSFFALAKAIAADLPKHSKVVLCAKGIDRESGRFLHEIAETEFGGNRISALSGPSFAADVVRGLPTAVSLAATELELAQQLAADLSTPTFRIYASDDPLGLEVGGALKNVLALAVGIARGLQLGASAEAALIARSFAEMNRIAMALGARSDTLIGLSGLGDLVLTCSSPQSRNFSYGMALARGENLSELPLAEGVATAAMALQKARENDIHAPIIVAVNDVLENRLSAQDAVAQLLARPLRSE